MKIVRGKVRCWQLKTHLPWVSRHQIRHQPPSHSSSSSEFLTTGTSGCWSETVFQIRISIIFIRIRTSIIFIRIRTSIIFIRIRTSIIFIRIRTSIIFLRISTSIIFIQIRTSIIFIRIRTSIIFIRIRIEIKKLCMNLELDPDLRFFFTLMTFFLNTVQLLNCF